MTDLNNKFCSMPWDYLELSHADSETISSYACCPMWTNNYSFGNLNSNNKNFESIWNSEPAKNFRKSILDGTFKYCNKNTCPYIVSNTLPSKDDVLSGKHGDDHKNIIEKNLLTSNYPKYISLSYDVSCNLSCPSCRKQIRFLNEKNNYEEYKFKQSLQDQLIDYLYKCKYPVLVTITGSGDPFASKLFWEFLQKLDGNLNKNISITLQTNGILFNRENWKKLHKLHNNVINAIISLDAGCEETYNYVRRGGNWKTLMDNLKFVSELHYENKLGYVRVDCVVQKKNYKELDKFVDIAKKYNFLCNLQKLIKITDTYTEEEFKLHDICAESHPEHEEFIKIINQDFNYDKLQFGNLSQFRKYWPDDIKKVWYNDEVHNVKTNHFKKVVKNEKETDYVYLDKIKIYVYWNDDRKEWIDMNDVFEKIYNDKIWAYGTILSGAGSCPIGAADYINFLKQYKNRNVLDLGCGDLSIYNKNIFFNNYIAVDVVDIPKYVDINDVKFIKSDIISFNYHLYDFNLIIIKDVFQHLSNQTIIEILNVLRKINCEILITNDFNDKENDDCRIGLHRNLNLCEYPFNITPINRYKWISKVDGILKETIICNLYGNGE